MTLNTISYQQENEYRLLRHATLLIRIGGTKLLIDPMLSAMGSMSPVANAHNQSRIPTMELPVSTFNLNLILDEIDAVIVTHTHRDHWDAEAQALVRKDTPVFCQPGDDETIRSQGFTQVQAIDNTATFKGITISRTRGQHGTGEIGRQMGQVSGFVLQHKAEVIYIAGDTVWCSEVEEAIAEHHPSLVIVNSGAARFLTGDPITMDVPDIVSLCSAFPHVRVVAVHLESVNHCLLSRGVLKEEMSKAGLGKRVHIPYDGDAF
ncbi:L-ascorbate metabolism protein UlaG (beta-lactamase superfamily) [Mucilaginibacter gracilis]|uniref:L-ascorbate metabolism protein UlaG (Beta-lactamase superfamily) n=1 Tax=Mucilaginibacter gracilis TaxID=423350 RepID=A0A495IX36_9SPHI|nr:MBL fold metallo-hydrolase [Mucilaginibacter gracilis]RKR80429.1 L-ascorbate metabolism protein UlaG (beta-lactamase superfamily) [Mucilaginibacter gracilis]